MRKTQAQAETTLHTSHSRSAAGAGGLAGGVERTSRGASVRAFSAFQRRLPLGRAPRRIFSISRGGLKGDKLSGAEWGGSAARALGVRCRQQVV